MNPARVRARSGLLWALLLAGSFAGCEGCHSHPHPHEAAEQTPHAEHGAGHEQGHEAAHGHGRGHGEDGIGITLWSSKLELFAEHLPAVTGQELTFLAHLTILDGFRALENATVTLVLDGPSRVEARVTQKLRSGIFQPSLIAPAAGTYAGSLVVTGPEVTDTLQGFEIVVHASKEAAALATKHEAEAGPEPIAFLKEQQWQVPFGTAFASDGSLVPTIEVVGEVTTPPSGQAEVGAPIAGRVVAPRDGLARPGRVVRHGELLATIAPAPAAPEAAAHADLAVVEAEGRVQAAQAALARAERLIADRAISEREVDDARRELGLAEESVVAARRARDVFTGAASGRGAGTYRLNAPLDGVVIEVNATMGKSVQAGDVLFRVANLDELWIRARVGEQQVALVRTDQDASFKLPGLDDWIPLDVTGQDAAASVVDVGRIVDRRSRTVDVLYALRRPDERLRIGAALRVAVPAGELWRGVVVPANAVLAYDGRSVVYVQVEGEAFEERNVRMGPRAGGSVGIVQGVNVGERVVTRGANVIRLSALSESAPSHGHVH